MIDAIKMLVYLIKKDMNYFAMDKSEDEELFTKCMDEIGRGESNDIYRSN